jgi:hypothetical protein
VYVLDPTNRPTLTLVTCYPFHWVGSAPKRFVVRCRPIGEGAVPETEPAARPRIAGSLATLPPDEEVAIAHPVPAESALSTEADWIDSFIESDSLLETPGPSTSRGD